MPPSLFVSNTDSLGEQIQRAFPAAKVVKALNTMNCEVMVDPGKVPGEHDVFLCGDLTRLARSFEDRSSRRQIDRPRATEHITARRQPRCRSRR
jgi:hypothetical protein